MAMKRIIALIGLLVVFNFTFLISFAFNPKYTVHTSSEDINYKKQKALNWYTSNVDGNKFYFYDAKKHVTYLKNRALAWHVNNYVNNKFYFVHPEHEQTFTKNKALKWYLRNSD